MCFFKNSSKFGRQERNFEKKKKLVIWKELSQRKSQEILLYPV